MITVNLTEYERRILIGYLLRLKRSLLSAGMNNDILKIEHFIAAFRNSKKEQ